MMSLNPTYSYANMIVALCNDDVIGGKLFKSLGRCIDFVIRFRVWFPGDTSGCSFGYRTNLAKRVLREMRPEMFFGGSFGTETFLLCSWVFGRWNRCVVLDRQLPQGV